MGLKYRIALGLALRPYWMGLLFTHDNGDFSAVPATERLTHAAPILSVDRQISGSFFCVIPRVFILYRPIAFHTDTQNYPVSVIESLSFTYTGNGKRQIKLRISQNSK